MWSKFLGKLVLLLVLLCLLWPIKAGDRKLKVIQVDYGAELVTWEQKIDSSLRAAGLTKVTVISQQQTTKVAQQGSYQFNWQYNSRKLEVPLFGPHGKLLAARKQEIIAAFRANFPVVKTDWRNQSEQVLTIKLGIKPRSDFKLFGYQVQFKQPRPKAKLAVVIDDFGFHRAGTAEMLSINRPLTLAILPSRPQTKRDAKLARQAGQEIILHQPLEPINHRANPGAGAIDTQMSQAQIKEVLRRNLDSLAPVVGINNHMGSKATADSRVMEAIMDVLKNRDIFYIDSSTAPNSIGLEIARINKVPTTVNHLFIDNVDDKEQIKEMILRLGRVALTKGELTIVGHVRKNTALALQETIPQLEEMGIKLVYVSQLVD